MNASGTVAVEATEKKYFGLRHMPGGLPLDAQGRGVWPADQFTFRLIGEGALREQEPVDPYSTDADRMPQHPAQKEMKRDGFV